LEERKLIMKNRVATYTAVICLLLAFAISGCAKKPADQTKEVATPQAQQEVSKGQTPEAAPAETKVVPTAFDKKIYFDFDKFNLDPKANEALDELVAFLKTNVNLKVKIEGNCDERGTTEYNIALGERRANSAQDYVISHGIDPLRVSTVSYGKEKAADPGHNEEAWAKNRRDEFVFSK
jgi:peptidoglycan-associated lipoprotein